MIFYRTLVTIKVKNIFENTIIFYSIVLSLMGDMLLILSVIC